MSKGYLCMVFHAHLPFVRHPEHEDFLEEDWLFEAITETYLPLLDMGYRLSEEGINFRWTISLTPPLCAMLSDQLLQERYRRHLNKLIALSEQETVRAKGDGALHRVTEMYRSNLTRLRDLYVNKFKCDLLSAFKYLQNTGRIEIITCGATHGFLPLQVHKQAVQAQIAVAVDDYKEKFGRQPRGIWLAECAYNPGDDHLLRDAGLRYFFLDSHAILYGKPRPRYGVFAPVYCPSGVAAFPRDMESAHQVWSAERGYPGDPRYREFYRDVGYDLPHDYLKPYLHSDGVRRNIGLKYHRITGKVPLPQKDLYNPDDAREAAATHAGHFMFNRERQIEHLRDFLGRKPLVVSMYDAELFGHWWYEGPQFLEFLFRKLHYDQKTIKLVTPSEYLALHPNNQVIQPSMSSWGDKGYNEVWLNESNDWIYPHLHRMAELMIELANKNPAAKGLTRRALTQAARELLLAQSSDWAFLMTTGTATHYATKRSKTHIDRFLTLARQIQTETIDEKALALIEYRDNIFPNLDYQHYQTDKVLSSAHQEHHS